MDFKTGIIEPRVPNSLSFYCGQKNEEKHATFIIHDSGYFLTWVGKISAFSKLEVLKKANITLKAIVIKF